ncbi:MAG TPA: AIR synthase-related protein, partial [Thermoanaerobaculia bacterium]
DVHIKLGSWPVLPIFKFLYEHGNVERDEMLRVFNMGIGMVLLVSKEDVERVSQHLTQAGQTFYFIGNVVRGSGKVQYDTPPAGFASWIE